MAISVRNLYELTKDKYKIKLIAGEEGLDNDVRWMYFMEDTEVADFLYGREFVITTGLTKKDEKWFMDLVNKLIDRNACGLILNVGKYITDIPKELISYCNKRAFPIFTIPWEIHIVDIVKEYCVKIFLSEQSEDNVSKALNQIIFNYKESTKYIKLIEDSGFNKDDDYIITLIKPHFSNINMLNDMNDLKIIKENIKILIRDILNRNFEHYNIIQKNDIYLMTIKSKDINTVLCCLRRICKVMEQRYRVKTNTGIGSSMIGFKALYSNYKRAKAALFMAESKDKNIEIFDKMGLYRAIFTAENDDILREIYYERLGTLIEYDKEHNSSLKETLKLYISNNKSVQAVSEKSYVHRNTINYRIKKIKELLECDLQDYEEVFAYELAFFIEESFNIS